MSVFVVTLEPYHDNSTVEQAFPSREAADAYVDAQTRDAWRTLWECQPGQPCKPLRVRAGSDAMFEDAYYIKQMERWS